MRSRLNPADADGVDVPALAQHGGQGHVGNRNPILGTGHTATDEPNCDIEGRKGPGTRGPKHLKQYQDWQTRGVNAPHPVDNLSPGEDYLLADFGYDFGLYNTKLVVTL